MVFDKKKATGKPPVAKTELITEDVKRLIDALQLNTTHAMNICR